jgi:carbamoyl-phosphate synthase small subunit
MTDRTPALLALEDGFVARGYAFGATGQTGGEICFNTSMTGYQEIATDPSYHGQIMTMTYPHIGNYGANMGDLEAHAPHIAGLVVRAYTGDYSNGDAEEALDAFMQQHGLIGISGVDTRRLVRHVRSKGVMNAVIASGPDLDPAELVEKAKAWPSMDGLELASRVTTDAPYDFAEGDGPRVAVYDYGVKQNILRSFARRGCTVRVFPASTPLDEVMEWGADGLFLSNGPGDPRAMPGAIETARQVIASGLPAFGICMGHQLLALAGGMDVFKMFVGHRGANQPVLNRETGQVEVTTQNHGFAVRADSVDPSVATVTHVNLNDDTVEGIRFAQAPVVGIQYHPEASPGPHDSHYLFDEFVGRMDEHRAFAA